MNVSRGEVVLIDYPYPPRTGTKPQPAEHRSAGVPMWGMGMRMFLRGIDLYCLGFLMMWLAGCNSKTSSVFSSSVDQALVEAACLGDIAAIEAAIADGANVNASGIDGVTPLYYVYLEAGSLTGYEELLKRGADPNILDVSGKSMMHTAARSATSSSWLQLALEYGGDPNIQEGFDPEGLPQDLQEVTDSGITPIFSAIGSGRLESVELLVEHGADVNIADNLKGWTPVVYSAHKREPVITQWLIQQGANWDGHTSTGLGLAEAEIRHSFDSTTEKDDAEAHAWVLDFLEMNGINLEEAEESSREIYGDNFEEADDAIDTSPD
jgi:ankyrin repeat protein